jgi:hypothetical protein
VAIDDHLSDVSLTGDGLTLYSRSKVRSTSGLSGASDTAAGGYGLEGSTRVASMT